ncbi:MAG: hypothetical protein M1454_03290, partial [Candidatus Thermoplasmatota archaeon]|nr:hypothetical protein [Candidatus Thermoplasmatota archaeon]
DNSLSVDIYAILHEEASMDKNLTVTTIDSGNGFLVNSTSGNFTAEIVTDGNYLIFVVSESLGTHRLTNSQFSALVTSEESALS